MKKYLLLICVVTVLITGCGTKKNVTITNSDDTQQVQEHVESDKDSQEYKERAYAFTKSFLAFAKGIKYSGENCELTSEGVASCFSKHMSESSVNGNVVNERHGGAWKFVINNDCSNVGECKVIADDQFEIVLYPDEDGYLTTDEPAKPW